MCNLGSIERDRRYLSGTGNVWYNMIISSYKNYPAVTLTAFITLGEMSSMVCRHHIFPIHCSVTGHHDQAITQIFLRNASISTDCKALTRSIPWNSMDGICGRPGVGVSTHSVMKYRDG